MEELQARIDALTAERDELATALSQERALRRSMEQQMLLSGAQALAQKKRVLVSGTFILLGIIGILCGFPLAALAMFDLVHDGAAGYAWSGSALAAGVLLAAAMPVDTAVIRAIAGLGVMAPFSIILLCISYSSVTLLGVRCTYEPLICQVSGWQYIGGARRDWRNVSNAVPSPIRSSALRRAQAPIYLHRFATPVGISTLPVTLGFLLTLRTKPDATATRFSQVWRWAHQRMGATFATLFVAGPCLPIAWALASEESSFAMEPRQALRRYWAIFRAWLQAIAITTLAAAVACASQGVGPGSSPVVAAWIFETVALLSVVVVASPRNRSWMHAKLSRVGLRSESSAAAGIASLIGGIDPKTALTTAEKSFLGIPFARLSKVDFASNSDSGLASRTVRCRLGDVDAFLSHSWHDDVDHKWNALMKFADDFVKMNKRDPACIDQSDIQKNLACLPVFLSGCNQLLILAGSTYTQRLWCVIEVFTFLKMGGSLERITLIPIASAAESQEEAQRQTIKRFEAFDATRAQCFVEAERQRLLAGLETGFGSLQQFNNLVAGIFSTGTTRSSRARAGSSRTIRLWDQRTDGTTAPSENYKDGMPHPIQV